MPKVKTTTYKTVSLSFSELENALKEHLKLDKDYKLSIRHNGDILWDSKITVELTKTTTEK